MQTYVWEMHKYKYWPVLETMQRLIKPGIFSPLEFCFGWRWRWGFGGNFTPLIHSPYIRYSKWNILHLSLAGRVNCIQMNVLSRFLFLFQWIPITLSKSFFQEIDQLISRFIWGCQTRIRKEYLQQQRIEGGLALPNLPRCLPRCYYWAVNIQKIAF